MSIKLMSCFFRVIALGAAFLGAIVAEEKGPLGDGCVFYLTMSATKPQGKILMMIDKNEHLVYFAFSSPVGQLFINASNQKGKLREEEFSIESMFVDVQIRPCKINFLRTSLGTAVRIVDEGQIVPLTNVKRGEFFEKDIRFVVFGLNDYRALPLNLEGISDEAINEIIKSHK